MPGRDYSADGAYFVTVCTVDRKPVFGEIVGGHVRLSPFGNAVADAWRRLPLQYPYVTLDEWCVMPDHLHGVLVLGDSQAAPTGDIVTTNVDVVRPCAAGDRATRDPCDSRTAPTGDIVTTAVDVPQLRRKPLGGLIGAFKTVSTKQINGVRNTPGAVVWQRDFWDHVIRDEADLFRVRAYIRENVHL